MAVGREVMEVEARRARRRGFRPWVERGLFVAVLATGAAYHFGLFGPGRQTCVIAVDGQPIVVVRSKAAAERLLEDIKQEAGDVTAAEFAQKVTLLPVPADSNRAISEVEAMKALSPRLTVVVPGAGLFVNGKLLVGLPDRGAAVETFSLLLAELSPPDPDLTRAFRERVSVQEARFPVRSYAPDAQTVLDRVRAAMAARGTYTVKGGDSPWKIANDEGITIPQLKGANPGVDFTRLQAGQALSIPRGKSPVTVVAWKEMLESVGDPAKGQTQTVRVTYENGAEMQRYVVQRPRRHEPERPRRRRHPRTPRPAAPAQTEEAPVLP